MTGKKLTKNPVTADEVACYLHNNGARITGNTMASDVPWFARRLYEGVSLFGQGWVNSMHLALSNEQFAKLKLKPARAWTGKRWETLTVAERSAWNKLARACLFLLPEICERLGHRGIEQAQAIRVAAKQEWLAQTEKSQG